MPLKIPRKITHAQWGRLAHVGQLLWWRGWVRRRDLVETFGISALQASHDLREFRNQYPGEMSYNQTEARYVATIQLRHKSDEPANLDEAAHILAQVPRPTSSGPWIGRVQLPARRADPTAARAVVRAIFAGQSLRIRYASIHSNTFRWRWITPHALGYDGWRWHTRAYCSDESAFRDFVIGRIAETAETGAPTAKPEDDLAWAEAADATVELSPALGEEQKRALKLDFMMNGDRLKLTASPALLHYTFAALGLAEDGNPQVPRFARVKSHPVRSPIPTDHSNRAFSAE